jgi:hypothetical protein
MVQLAEAWTTAQSCVAANWGSVAPRAERSSGAEPVLVTVMGTVGEVVPIDWPPKSIEVAESVSVVGTIAIANERCTVGAAS